MSNARESAESLRQPSESTTSRPTYVIIYFVLLALLVLTVASGRVDLGRLGPVVAMAIAIAKMLLIVIYFMHLRDAGMTVRVFAGIGFVWLMILLTFTLADYLTRAPAGK